MDNWKINQPLTGCFRQIIDGGRPSYCRFDYAISPMPLSDPIRVVLAAEADQISERWFPHLKRGILSGITKAEEYGRHYVDFLIEVKRIYDHPVDTTEDGCEFFGRSFVLHVIRDNAIATT